MKSFYALLLEEPPHLCSLPATGLRTTTAPAHIPPPKGVPGWGAFTTAKPGVKIWPLETVKDWAAAL